jgi:hypothetical protein
MPPSRAAIELVGAPVDEAELDVGEADAPVAALGLGDADLSIRSGPTPTLSPFRGAREKKMDTSPAWKRRVEA